MSDFITIGNKKITKNNISSMNYEEQISLLGQIVNYKKYLDDCYEYIEDINILKYPEKHKNNKSLIDFGGGVFLDNVLSFLQKTNGKTATKIHI